MPFNIFQSHYWQRNRYHSFIVIVWRSAPRVARYVSKCPTTVQSCKIWFLLEDGELGPDLGVWRRRMKFKL